MIVVPLPFRPEHLNYRGMATASYDTLRSHLGPPTSPLDAEKTHAEWMVQTPVGPLNVYDFGDLHNCRITPPRAGERYPGGCRRNPAHRLRHKWLHHYWSVQAEDDDAVAWLAHLADVYVSVRHPDGGYLNLHDGQRWSW